MHRHVNRWVNLSHVARNLSTHTTEAAVSVASLEKEPRNVFGTLSESGRKLLARRVAEQDIKEDLSGYDTLEFDIEARKNQYYYKYEITKQARQGRQGIRRALELFHEMKAKARLTPSMDNFSTLIYGCAKAGYTKRAFELYDELFRYHEKASNSIITCLINACAESPFPEYGLQRLDWFLKHLKVESNKELNLIQYNTAIKAYGKLGRLDEASKLIQEMVDKDIRPDLATLNMLLIGCASNKEAGCSLALRVYKRIKMYEMKPDLVTYRLLLRCIRDCGLGSPQLIAETLKELPALTSFSQRLEYRERLKKRSKRDREKPVFEWAPLITDLGKTFAEAVEMPRSSAVVVAHESVSDSRKDETKWTDLDQKTHQKLSSDVMQFIEPEEQMLPNLLSPDHLSLMGRIKSIQLDKLKLCHDRLTLFGGLHGYLATMMEDGCKPDNKTFSLLLDCLKPTKENYLEYYKLAQDLKIERDLVFYDLLIQHICTQMANRALRLELALKFVEKMHLDNLRPNISTFEALASGCSDWRQASQLMDDIDKCGFIVSEIMIARFFQEAIYTRKFDYLAKLVRYCLDCKQDFKPNKLLVDKLEALKLEAYKSILRQERTSECERVFSNKAVAAYDEFRSLMKVWLDRVELREEDHPWMQYQVEHGSMNARFKAYERQMKAADYVKRDALKRGEKFGNLYEKSAQLIEANNK